MPPSFINTLRLRFLCKVLINSVIKVSFHNRISLHYPVTTDYKRILNESNQLITESCFVLDVTLLRQLKINIVKPKKMCYENNKQSRT